MSVAGSAVQSFILVVYSYLYERVAPAADDREPAEADDARPRGEPARVAAERDRDAARTAQTDPAVEPSGLAAARHRPPDQLDLFGTSEG